MSLVLYNGYKNLLATSAIAKGGDKVTLKKGFSFVTDAEGAICHIRQVRSFPQGHSSPCLKSHLSRNTFVS